MWRRHQLFNFLFPSKDDKDFLCRALVLPRALPGSLALPGAADVTTLFLTLAKPLPLPRPEEREFDKSLTVDANSSKLDRVDVKVRGVVVR